MREYIDGKPVQDVARKVIAKWHTDLDNPKILYLIDTETMKSRGFETLAKIRKATPVESHLNGGLDLVLIVSGPIWKAMTDEQKLALIDHELCHVELTSPESGEPGAYLLRGHDIEEFNVIVKRHGDWWPHVAAFFNSAQRDLFDRRLPREDGNEVPTTADVSTASLELISEGPVPA